MISNDIVLSLLLRRGPVLKGLAFWQVYLPTSNSVEEENVGGSTVTEIFGGMAKGKIRFI